MFVQSSGFYDAFALFTGVRFKCTLTGRHAWAGKHVRIGLVFPLFNRANGWSRVHLDTFHTESLKSSGDFGIF